MSPSSLINLSHGMRMQAAQNKKILDQGVSMPRSSYTERQPSSQSSRYKQQGSVQVFHPSKSQQTSGGLSRKPRNAVDTSETSGPGHLPPRLSNQGRVTVLTRSSEKSATSSEFNQVMQELKDNSEAEGNRGQQRNKPDKIVEGSFIDINQQPTQDGVLVDLIGGEQLNSDWVNTDLAIFGVDEGENASVSNEMTAAIQGLSELGVNELNVLPSSMDGGENEDDITEVVEEESVVEVENMKEKSPGNEVSIDKVQIQSVSCASIHTHHLFM